MSGLYGNATGGFGMPKMVEIVDENGNTIIGTVTDSAVTFDATRDDVKVGKVFASNDGVQEGTDTKTYRITIGTEVILKNESFSIPLEKYNAYDYTKFTAMIAPFNTTVSDSVAINKVSIDNAVYNTNSTTKISDLTKNVSTKSVEFNLVNNTGNTCVIHYSTCKEE